MAMGAPPPGGIADAYEAPPLLPQQLTPAPKPATAGEMYDAGATMARGDRTDAETLRLLSGYDPIVRALGLRDTQNPGQFSDTTTHGEPMLRKSDLLPDEGFGSFAAMANRSRQEELVAAEIRKRRAKDAGFLSGVPDNVPDLHAYFLKQEAAERARAREVMSRSPGFWGGSVPAFAGGAVEGFGDPMNLVTMAATAPIGGEGGLLVKVGRDALINGVSELAQQPLVAMNRAELGEHLTAGEAVENTLMAAAGGAAFSGVTHAVGKGVGTGVNALAPDLAQQFEARGFGKSMDQIFRNAETDPAAVDHVARGLLNPDNGQHLVDSFRHVVPEGIRTPEERAALNVVETAHGDAATSPFTGSTAGAGAHQANLDEALQALVSGQPSRPPPRVLGPDDLPPIPSAGGIDANGYAAGGRAAVSTSGRPQSSVTGDAAIAAFKAKVHHAENNTGNHAQRNLMGSSASGDFQFTDGTFRSYYSRVYGQDPGAHPASSLKNDPAVQSRLMDALTADNRDRLERIGAPVTEGNLYLMHVFGEGDGPRILRADPSTPIDRILSAKAVRQNKLEGKSTSQVIAWAHGRMGGTAASVPVKPGFAFGGEVDDGGSAVAQLREQALELERQAYAEEPLEFGGAVPPMYNDRFRPGELTVDAKRFQFKGGGDEAGVTDRLQGITEWNPIYAGRVIVWEDGAGTRFIADGHQRHGLASRIEAQTGEPVHLDATVLREADGVTAQDARVIAALKNIAEGSGTSIDAAKVIRDAGEHILPGLPPKSPLVRDGRALAHLSDEAFGAVYNGVISPDIAAVIGHLLPDNPDAHAGMIDLLKRLDPANRGQAESIVRQAIAAGFHKAEQSELFGTREMTSSLFLERAKVLERGLARLRKLKLVYGTAAKEAATLEAVGSKIARSKSEREATQNGEAIEIVSRLAFSRGPVADALNDAAARLAAGEPLGSVTDGFVKSVRGVDLRAAANDAGRGASDRLAPDGAGRGGDAGEADAALPAQPGDQGQPRLAGLEDAGQLSAFELDQARRFDDPHAGDGPKAQVESLEHDVRASVEAADGGTEFDIGAIKAAARQAGVHIDAHEQGGVVYLNSVERLEGSAPGSGAKAIEAVLAKADEAGLPVALRASGPRGDARPPEGLVRYYEQFGFKQLYPGRTEMVRPAALRGKADAQTVIAGQRGAPIEDLLARAETNQRALATFGEDLGRELGVEFVNPGAKSPERVLKKIADDGYSDPGEIKDLARGGFLVTQRDQGDKIVAELAKHFQVYDKGWKPLDGYLDRKVIVRFENGGVAEIQIIPKVIADHKFGAGHAAYERLRDPATPIDEFERLLKETRETYSSLLSGSEFEALGKADAKSAGASSDPSTSALRTSEGEAGDQAPPSNTSPVSGSETATGRSSSSNNLMGEPSAAALDMGAKGDPGKIARDRQIAELAAASPLRSLAEQDGTMGLAMFDHADQPGFRLEIDGHEISAKDLLAELDADTAALETLKACL